VAPTTTGCLGYVYNSPQSQTSIRAEMWASETTERLLPGSSFTGTSTAPAGGFKVGDDTVSDDYHVTIDYFEISGGYLETHDLDVTETRRFDVYPCHEAYITVTVIPDGNGAG
jgi:hypothetical protein